MTALDRSPLEATRIVNAQGQRARNAAAALSWLFLSCLVVSAVESVCFAPYSWLTYSPYGYSAEYWLIDVRLPARPGRDRVRTS